MTMKLQEINGNSLKTSSKPWEIRQQLIGSQLEWDDFPTHPESLHLKKYSWEGMLTIRFEHDWYSSDTTDGQLRRDHLIHGLMNNLSHRKWKLRDHQVYWVASTEFGKSGEAHCHILFSFNLLKKKNKRIPDLADFEEQSLESLHHICNTTANCPFHSVNLKWSPKYYNSGLVAYVCKKEYGREDYKHFLFSNPAHRWAHQSIEEAIILAGGTAND